VSACPSLETLERGGDEVDSHLARCPVCRSLAELMIARSAADEPGDCARAEVLIAAGGDQPLSGQDAVFLPAHLLRCRTCRESALDPPLAYELGPPVIDPDTYTLGAEIGRGGMGRVLSARDRRIGRAVALKEMLEKDPIALARFEREARITAQLQHPNIVSIYEVGRWPDGRPFYAMPILPGRTLREAMSAARNLRERLHLLPNLIAAADAIAYAHSRRVIHRDLSPSNILLGSFGETTVIDWGVAKELDENAAEVGHTSSEITGLVGLTVFGTVIGTPAYIAPEAAEGRPVDERADVYALGAILLQLLTGRPPYDGLGAATVIDRLRARQPPIVPHNRQLPKDLMSVARKAMNLDADRRYPSASEFVEELRRYQSGERVGAYRYSTRELAFRWMSRRLSLVVMTSIMLVLLAASGVVGSVRVLRERERADARTAELEKMKRALAAPELARAFPRRPIRGWIAAGGAPADYDMGLDDRVTWQSGPSAFIRSNKPAPADFGTLMQTFAADAYRGKRLRFSAQVRSDHVADWAGLWMRIDSKVRGETLAFDNMQDRSIQGTKDWQPHQVVLDVPQEAEAVALGVLLSGPGAVWLSGLRIEPVDQTIPVTGRTAVPQHRRPRNLDFSAPASPGELPPGWTRFGNGAADVGLDKTLRFRGKPSGFVRAHPSRTAGFASLMQTTGADEYRGRRVRLTAFVRTSEANDGAGLWMRVDGRSGKVLEFDNMSDRWIVGTRDWSRHDVVLDVPEDASSLNYGSILVGAGSVHIAAVTLEPVDRSVSETGGYAPVPQNLELTR
jgi:serine/threonine protein kinase